MQGAGGVIIPPETYWPEIQRICDEYGILLLADIARLVLGRDRSPDRVNVYEIMSKPVLSVNPAMDIRYCARLFDRFGLSMAPVIEGGEVIGLVSYNDLVLKGMIRP